MACGAALLVALLRLWDEVLRLRLLRGIERERAAEAAFSSQAVRACLRGLRADA